MSVDYSNYETGRFSEYSEERIEEALTYLEAYEIALNDALPES